MTSKINWPASAILIDRPWSTLKNLLNGTEKRLKLQVEENDFAYHLFCIDAQVIYRCFLYKSSNEPIGWTQDEIDQNAADIVEYLASYASNKNKPIVVLDDTGKPVISPIVRAGEEFMFVTHNYCDPTTWYQDSERITSGALTLISGTTIFSLNQTNIIDITHGKIHQEALEAAKVAHGYAVQIFSSGYLLTERTPFTLSGGDYVLNYSTGIVTFASGHSAENLRANFSYATDSIFTFMAPSVGTELNITYVEAQFSTAVQYNDTIIVQIYGYADVFAPQYGFPPGTKIPLMTLKYKTLDNIVEEARGPYPEIPAMGGSLRGFDDPRFTFPFIYTAARRLQYDAGMDMRIFLENNQTFGGAYCTITFYGTVESSS